MPIQLSMPKETSVMNENHQESRPECPNMGCENRKEKSIPYAPRSRFRDHIREAFEHHSVIAEAYHPLLEQQKPDGSYLSCPICRTNEQVISGGTQNDGTKKFRCCNSHSDNDNVSGKHFHHSMPKGWKGNFSTFTSFEAHQLYIKLIVETIVLFIKTNSTISGLASYLGVSKDFIRMALLLALQAIQDEKIELDMSQSKDFVLVFFDYSGCVLSRRLSFVLANINGQLIWKIVSGSNRLTIWDFLKSIKDIVEKNAGNKTEELKYVFVTDGEISFVDSIGALFPDSIHIRQFHKKELRGLVYTHFPNYVKTDEEADQVEIQRYTISCSWDIVLSEGIPNDRTLAQRKRRKEKLKENGEEREKHDWEIKLWTYVKYTQRTPSSPKNGNLEKSNRKTVNKQHIDCISSDKKQSSPQLEVENDTARVKVDEETSSPSKPMKEEKEIIKTESPKRESTYTHAPKKKHKPKKPKPKPIVFDTISEAKKNTTFLQIFGIFVMIFGGLYIQSNKVENSFNVKATLKPHRVMKTGTNILQMILHSQLRMKKMSAPDLRRYFLERISSEMILQWIPPSNKTVSEVKRKKEEIRQLISEACQSQQLLAITYTDRKKTLTRRGILVRDYDEEYIRAYCFLRNDQRTFRIDRINHAYLCDDSPLIFPTT